MRLIVLSLRCWQSAGERTSSAAEGVWGTRDGTADSSQRIEGGNGATE